jgi:hypothetical protein
LESLELVEAAVELFPEPIKSLGAPIFKPLGA